jgi:hypothetical protein
MATRGSAGPAITHYIIRPSAKGTATVTMRSGLTIISKDFDLYSQNQMKPVCMTERHTEDCEATSYGLQLPLAYKALETPSRRPEHDEAPRRSRSQPLCYHQGRRRGSSQLQVSHHCTVVNSDTNTSYSVHVYLNRGFSTFQALYYRPQGYK